MGTITTATTAKTKGAMRGDDDSEEFLTSTPTNGIMQVTSFESSSHRRTNSMDMENIGNVVIEGRNKGSYFGE